MCKIKAMEGKKLLMVLFLLFALPFKMMAATYTYQAGRGLVFAWEAKDKVGITAGESSEQVNFLANTSTTSGSCSLYSFGSNLYDAVKYYSYYPYKWNISFDATAVALSYTGQQQSANASTTHLWSYDYSASEATPSNGACTFNYHHLSGFLRITFRVPSGISGSATLSIKTKDNVIPNSTSLNLKSQGTSSETTYSALANTLSISLSGLTSGSTYIAYLSIPAKDLSNENINIVITPTSGSATTLATIKGPNIRSGYLYDINLYTASQIKSNSKAVLTTPENMTTAASVSNPTAVSSSIPFDPSFTLQVIPSVLGDVNGDQKVNIVDVALLIKHLKSGTTSSLSKTTCDTNNDGQITVLDVKGIVDIIIK